jgi:hypothetical protein
MFAAAEELRFEYAAKLRDEIKAIRLELELREEGLAPPGPDADGEPAPVRPTRPGPPPGPVKPRGRRGGGRSRR